MRTIRELVREQELVWAYMGAEDMARRFLRQAEAEGFCLSGGAPTAEAAPAHVMAIHRDLTIAYLPIYIWQWSFDRPYIFARSGMRVPKRVDFSRYCAGAEDYICRRSPFTRLGGSPQL